MSNARKLSLFLADYNLWRLGGLDEMPSSHIPAKISAAIDEAVDLLEKYDELERENAALREAGHLAEKIIVQRTDEIRHLERENAALRHSEENLASTVRGLEFENEKLERENAAVERTIENLRARLWGTEFELEKAKAELDWLNTNCVSADPIMGRSTYRWTIEHDEPDIRVAIAELRKAQV